MVPSPITHTSGRLLEFEALREMLRAYSSSPLGHARVTELAPTTDLAYIRRQQQLTAEVREFLRAGNRFEFAGLLDPTIVINKARIEGAALETLEIRDIIALVDRAAEWHQIVAHPPAAIPQWLSVAELSA